MFTNRNGREVEMFTIGGEEREVEMFTIGGEDMEGEMFTNQNGREVEMFTKRDNVIEEKKERTCWNCVYCNSTNHNSSARIQRCLSLRSRLIRPRRASEICISAIWTSLLI